MTFPTINYKFNNLDEAQELTELVEQKYKTLEKYLGKHNSSSCEVSFNKETSSQNGKIYKIEVNLIIDGELYRAGATEHSFEEAIDEVRDELDKELRRAKDKQETLEKQAGREAKEKMMATVD